MLKIIKFELRREIHQKKSIFSGDVKMHHSIDIENILKKSTYHGQLTDKKGSRVLESVRES